MLLAVAGVASAKDPRPFGEYRLVGERDVASGIRLHPNGRFQYFLIAGALDEQAEGGWSVSDGLVALVTEPKPVPPAFSQAESRKCDAAPLSVEVSWPDGRGIAGVGLRIGFDEGPPMDDYTQKDGWALPPEEKRTPRWIELMAPTHDVTSPRFPIDVARANALRFVLTPNDLGTLDFEGVRAELAPDRLVLQRGEARLVYARVRK